MEQQIKPQHDHPVWPPGDGAKMRRKDLAMTAVLIVVSAIGLLYYFA